MLTNDAILGRSDDMIVYRGVNIYPGQITDVIGQFPSLSGEYQLELSRDERGIDHLALSVERSGSGDGDAALAAKLEEKLHKALLARVQARIVDYASLPRTFGKSRRVVDLRDREA